MYFKCSLRLHVRGECGSFFGFAEKRTTNSPNYASEASNCAEFIFIRKPYPCYAASAVICKNSSSNLRLRSLRCIKMTPF
jgi:hypothetical protein